MLDRLLPQLPKSESPDLIVGPSTLDDAGVFRLDADTALVQTVDFLTPIVDDPYDYGRIAAANSLSDVYAMGGRPVTALNILAFPDGKLPEEALAEILSGAADICQDAGVVVIGGHSVTDPELKFGLSVTGLIHPDRILVNSGAKAGDALLLTKPLGTGLIANAMMNDAAPGGSVEGMVASMIRLNRAAATAALACGAHGVTDVTGYGLLGHGREMAIASHVALEIQIGLLPLLAGAMDVASSGSYYSGGERRNLLFVEKDVRFDAGIPDSLKRIVADPQTSGGLLVALPPERVAEYLAAMGDAGEEAWQIGTVRPFEGARLTLVQR